MRCDIHLSTLLTSTSIFGDMILDHLALAVNCDNGDELEHVYELIYAKNAFS